MAKAQEYLAAARSELDSGRFIAATSLSVHAAINAADAVAGLRIGVRSAATDHDQVIVLLGVAGQDGVVDVARDLGRLLALKTKAEYDPDDIPRAEARRAVERADRCVAVAERVAAQRNG